MEGRGEGGRELREKKERGMSGGEGGREKRERRE